MSEYLTPGLEIIALKSELAAIVRQRNFLLEVLDKTVNGEITTSKVKIMVQNMRLTEELFNRLKENMDEDG